MKPRFNSADADTTDTVTDATGARQLRRLAALEVQVADLDRARRRSLTMGPILLLVVANVTPLVIVRPRNDPDEQYTLLQVVFGGVKALPVGWFVLLGWSGCSAWVLRSRSAVRPDGPATPGRWSRRRRPCSSCWW